MTGLLAEIPTWADRFVPFSATHGIVTLAFLVGTIALCHSLSELRDSPRRSFELFAGMWGFGFAALYAAWWMFPKNFDVNRSLPLHVCDVMSFLSPISLLSGRRRYTTFAVFFGLAFCTQAFVRPLAGPGPLHLAKWAQFWGFWITHAVVVFVAVYWVWVRGYRPRWSDFKLASIVAWVYVGIIFVFDAATGLNYVYVGRGTPTGETFADDLGPWPLRALWIALIGQAALLAVMLLRLLPGGEKRRTPVNSRA
ncbi:MAG: TIGR02206 family membrane protein [Phycisphaerae bacterium]|nr:TIGR02206 family membrane protein [Phycisphaerae bacterium]MBN8596734.1 TIGR02206 family membrane protein [Planctomycetota bacterium]